MVKQSLAVPNDMIDQGIFVGNPTIRIIAKKKKKRCPILYNSIVGGWADSWLTLTTIGDLAS